ncbi:unnamed protein product, partial [Hapterophycus canaliculatus]
MSITVADYAVLRDTPVVLETGQDWNTPGFIAPKHFVVGTNLARAILTFNLMALSDPPFAPGVDMHITHFGTEPQEIYRSFLFNGTASQTVTETFPATNFSTLVRSPFHFSVTRGRVSISDVVLWYQ